MTEGVKMFLAQIDMIKYFNIFVTKGFDLESDIPHLTSHDLENVLMVSSPEDRSIILSNAQSFCPSPAHAVHEWLSSNSLDYYFIAFVQSDLTDLQKIAHLSLPNEDLYDELEIVLPGHRKRLERAVQKLKHDQQNTARNEAPVTHGWWGKPKCLPQAKFDFLCVRALLYSPLEPQHKEPVDFMVDSGSDVSTVQEDILRQLNLELIGPIYSCGIHGGNHTNLYRAKLMVGDQEMDIEIMGSNYNSLGSRVVRHFRHVIDGHNHIWLKGNYKDELPAILPLALPLDSSDSQRSQMQGSGEINRQVDKAHQEPRNKELERIEIPTANNNELCNIPRSSNVVYQEKFSSDTSVSKEKDCNSLNKNEDKKSFCPSNDKPSSKGKKGLKSKKPEINSVLENSSALEHSAKCKAPSNISEDIETENSVNVNNSLQCHSGSTEHSNGYNSNQNGNSFKPGSNSDSFNNCSTEREGSPTNHCSNKRVSFSNIIPPSLRDTDDDIDHMNISTSAKINTQTYYLSTQTFDSDHFQEENTQKAKMVTLSQNNLSNSFDCNTEDIVHIGVSEEEDQDEEKESQGFAVWKASHDIMLISFDELELPQKSNHDQQSTTGYARKHSNHAKDNSEENQRESMEIPKKRARLDH